MRNTAERNLSAMSVKWSSKELANPRALSVIYDGEPITSRLRKWLGKSKIVKEYDFMSVSTIFSYRLKDAWGFPLCKVSVSVGGSKSRVRYKIVNEKRHSRQLNDDVICEINAIMEAHPKIWTYDEFSLEVPSGLLDGVMNFFEFATLDGKSVHFFASNIGEVRDPDAHFSLSLSDRLNEENADREVIPIKAMEVVKTFDEIAAVLVKAGVPKEYFSLWPK